MSENSRQQRMIERVEEDQHLRGDLVGETAQQLLDWATAKVRALTDDPAQPDAEVEAQVQAVRLAARQAARAGAAEPQGVVALAEAALAADTPAMPLPQIAQPTPWQRWRERVRRWFSH